VSRQTALCTLFLGAALTACSNGGGPFDAHVVGDGPAMAMCSPDPLHTGLAMPPDVDRYDCEILQAAQRFNEPDAMIFKAIIDAESRFHFEAAACLNLPCGMPAGWTSAESQCFGLMQIVPACGGNYDGGPATNFGLLANGHPNLTLDTTSSGWASSIFNPAVNIAIGVAGIADNRRQEMQHFPGCTQDQYTLMAIGDYNNYGSTRSCTQYNTDYDNAILMTYHQYASASGWPAHSY
jgi:hypothetical protein